MSMAVRMTDFGPEFAQEIAAGVHSQHDSARGEAASQSMQPRWLPSARNQSAAEIAGDAPQCRSAFTSGRLMSDHGANERVFHPRAKHMLDGAPINTLLMTHIRDDEMDRIL